MQKKIRVLAIFNFVALAIHISFSYATQFKLVNNKTVGQISDQYPSLFTPAGITFAIWGIIYLALIAFCIYHIVMAFKHLPSDAANKDINRISVWFIFNNLAATAWLLVWTHERIAYSLALIFFQLITLIIIHIRTGIYDTGQTAGSKIFTQFPLSIYLGWISIATIANTAIYLSIVNWNGLGLGYTAISWTRIMIAVAVFITVIVVTLRNNVFYGLVVLWALYGIFTELQITYAYSYAGIIQTAWIGMAIVGMACIVQFVKNITTKKLQPPSPEIAPSE